MIPSPQEELAFLVHALRAHVEWLGASGASGAIKSNDAWLELRREQYRTTEYLHGETTAESALAAEPQGASDGESLEEAHLSEPSPPEPSQAPLNSPTTSLTPAAAVLHAPSVKELRPYTSEPTIRVVQSVPLRKSVTRDWREQLTPLEQTAEAKRQLTLLREEVQSCTRCALHEARTNTVFSRGSGRSGICFVGEGPGADEDAEGLPFVGKAGQLLDRMVSAMGFDRDDVYVCNIVKCRPPNNRKPELAEMLACKPFIHDQLELIQPRVIVALGATAVHGLLGLGMGITRLRGEWRLYRGKTPVMPTFHPAYLLRNPDAKREVWSDLQQVLKEVSLPVPGRE
jgi:DNA polymerase